MQISPYLLTIIDFVSENFEMLRENLFRAVVAVYFVYGLLLAIDAKRRYYSWAAPLIVFLLWLLFSLLFFPIYLIVRPARTIFERESEQLQNKAILLDGGMSNCQTCNALIKTAANYCYSCGSKAHQACPNCQKKLANFWDYCVYCGYKITPAQVSWVEKLTQLLTDGSSGKENKSALNKPKGLIEIKAVVHPEAIAAPQDAVKLQEATRIA